MMKVIKRDPLHQAGHETIAAACASDPLLEVRGLQIRFQNEQIPRLRDGCITIERSKPVAVVGPSGSGKSIFLLALAGLLNGADVRFERIAFTLGGEQRAWGTDTPYEVYRQAVRPWLARHASFLFQDAFSHLHPLRSVLEQLLEDAGGDEEKVREVCGEASGVGLLPLVDIDEDRAMAKLARSNASSLSGGMCQRVFLARALLRKPELLIADEPFTDIDPISRRPIQEQLARHFIDGSGAGSLLLATHDLQFLEEYDFIARGAVYRVDPKERCLVRWDRLDIPEPVPMRTPPPVTATGTIVEIAAGSEFFYTEGQRLALRVGGTLEVRNGETLGLVGESGSGKSTAAKLLARLMSSPSFKLDLPPLDHLRGNTLYRAVQVAFQDAAGTFNARETTTKILERILRLRKLDPKEVDLDEIFKMVKLDEDIPEATSREAKRRPWSQVVLERLGWRSPSAPDVLRPSEKRPFEMSMGMQRRFSLVRALLSVCSGAASPEPRLVILDEVTLGLDRANRDGVIELLYHRRLGNIELPEEITYVIISHDLDFVRELCHRIVVLFRGWVVEVVERSNDPQRPWAFRHPYSQHLFAANARELTLRREGAASSDALCPFFPYCPLVPPGDASAIARCSSPSWYRIDPGGSRYLCSVPDLEEV